LSILYVSFYTEDSQKLSKPLYINYLKMLLIQMLSVKLKKIYWNYHKIKMKYLQLYSN